MSIYKPGGKTVNVFARDAESLRADPPKFTTTFTGSGIEKLDPKTVLDWRGRNGWPQTAPHPQHPFWPSGTHNF
jgi:hypothetical protein